ncbi:MAG: ABC transporter permease [Chloroflexi bacterium]|nr:ABC transporter permease [Chloroflexota bacterium]
MGFYIARRLAGIVLTMLAVSFLVYTGLTLAPGDTAEALLGEHASAEQVAALRSRLNLDAPLPERYADYMAAAVSRGDLGRSLLSDRPVAEVIRERLPATLLLAGLSVLLAAGLGIALGLLAAVHRGGRLDLALVSGTVLGLAIPPYWLAILFIQFFALRLGWLPVFGSGTAAHLVLPTLTLSLPAMAVVARLVRASVIEVSRSDFVRTALAKGLPPRRVLLRHILPNSLLPALVVLGLNLGHLVGGAFVVETIFAWPGLGRLTVQAIFDRDIPMVMGSALVVAPLCLGVNLAVDLLHGMLDPRVRHGAL